MKGRKLVLITCVIVLSFTGVGYSSWTQDLNIKSLFTTGNIHIIFEDPVIVNNELYEINVDGSEGVLDIYGAVAPGSTVLVEYDIYNDSSIPVKYHPNNDALPEGISLNQNDSVIQPGEYLRGNQMTIEPGENECILPFAQYNHSVRGGWQEELTIRWNITVIEEPVEPELEMMIEEEPQAEEPIEEEPQTETPVIEITPEVEAPSEAPSEAPVMNEIVVEDNEE